MTARAFGRSWGTVIVCNAFPEGHCRSNGHPVWNGPPARSVTAQAKISLHWRWLLQHGWAKGTRRATKHDSGNRRHHLCPGCAIADRLASKTRRTAWRLARERGRARREAPLRG